LRKNDLLVIKLIDEVFLILLITHHYHSLLIYLKGAIEIFNIICYVPIRENNYFSFNMKAFLLGHNLINSFWDKKNKIILYFIFKTIYFGFLFFSFLHNYLKKNHYLAISKIKFSYYQNFILLYILKHEGQLN